MAKGTDLTKPEPMRGGIRTHLTRRKGIRIDYVLAQVVTRHPTSQEAKLRHLINRRVRPHIGELRLQAITPGRLTKLYRELATSGGRDGAGMSPRTVEYVHAVLTPALALRRIASTPWWGIAGDATSTTLI